MKHIYFLLIINIVNCTYSTHLDRQLTHAVTNQDENTVVKLIKQGACVNGTIKNLAAPPLHIAIFTGNISIIKHLIAADANLNAQDSIGDTPCLLVAKAAQEEILLLLLKAHVNVNIKDHAGRTPLCWAAMEYRIASYPTYKSIIYRLIASGAHAQDDYNHAKNFSYQKSKWQLHHPASIIQRAAYDFNLALMQVERWRKLPREIKNFIKSLLAN